MRDATEIPIYCEDMVHLQYIKNELEKFNEHHNDHNFVLENTSASIHFGDKNKLICLPRTVLLSNDEFVRESKAVLGIAEDEWVLPSDIRECEQNLTYLLTPDYLFTRRYKNSDTPLDDEAVQNQWRNSLQIFKTWISQVGIMLSAELAEQKTAEELMESFPGNSIVLHNINLPAVSKNGKEDSTENDIVFLTDGMIFLIEVKNYSKEMLVINHDGGVREYVINNDGTRGELKEDRRRENIVEQTDRHHKAMNAWLSANCDNDVDYNVLIHDGIVLANASSQVENNAEDLLFASQIPMVGRKITNIIKQSRQETGVKKLSDIQMQSVALALQKASLASKSYSFIDPLFYLHRMQDYKQIIAALAEKGDHNGNF